MLRECVQYLKENEKKWKVEEEERLTERQKQEEKNKRQQKAKKMQETETSKSVQNKITTTWSRIPELEQRHMIAEEEKGRRFELREAKVNMWKRWRGEPE